MPETGVIFDFDGVIVLSEAVHQRAWVDLAREAGRELPEGFLETGVGYSDAILSATLAEHWGGDRAPLEILESKRRAYQARCMEETQFVPGAREALAFFSSRHPLALATSSTLGDIRPHLHGMGLDRHFKAVLTIDNVTRPKPDPEIYLMAAGRLGLAPERCWVFEDSVHGAAAARAAGMRIIGMTTTFGPGGIGPVEAEFQDYSDLPSIYSVIAGG